MTESSKDKVPLPTIFGAIAALGIAATVFVGPYLYGTTPAQVMDEPLRTPSEIARDLKRTSVSGSSVTATFRKGSAGDYESVSFVWSSSARGTPTGMRLRAERGADADAVSAVLRRRLGSFGKGEYRWGPVRIRVRDDGDVSFDVDPEVHKKPNLLLERQVEAARQLVLNAAFGLPIRLSEREIVDALGTGYSPAALARFDATTRVENAEAALRASFPATIAEDSSRFDVPLDHPLVRDVTLSWSNQPGGRLDDISLDASSAYSAGRAGFERCLATQLGPPKIDVTDYAADKKEYAFAIGKVSLDLREHRLALSTGATVDPASFAELFRALDACRDAAESGGATK